MTDSAVERYLRLGLQFGRHVERIVDAYYGPLELAAAVEAEPLVDPRVLISAETLLDELEDGWLRDQLVGLRTYAGTRACGRSSRAATTLAPSHPTAPGSPRSCSSTSPPPTATTGSPHRCSAPPERSSP